MKTALFASLMLAGGMAQAEQVIVDFDSTLPTYFGLSSYQEDGFTLSSNVPDGTIIDVNNVVRGNLGVYSGGTSSQSLFWGANGSQSTISISNDLGLSFSLDSLDASSFTNATGTLYLSGVLTGGGSVNQVLNLNSSLTSYGISGMEGLASVDIYFDGLVDFAPFDLDNISMNVIPIPAAVWLFGSGLAVLFGWRRRS